MLALAALALGLEPLDIPNDKCQFPLHFAAFKQHAAAVRVLLEQGAATLVLERKGRTPAEDTSNVSLAEEIRAAQNEYSTAALA